MTMELVLIGGGHAHVHVLKMLGMSPYREIRQQHDIHVTLVTNTLLTPYSGMLPGYVAGHYSFEEVHLDLVKLCRFSGIRLIHAACTEISHSPDHTNQGEGGGGWIRCDVDDQPPIRYNVTSLDIGSTPGANDWTILEHPRIIPVKPIANFCRLYRDLQERFSSLSISPTSDQDGSGLYTIAVVGGGAGGVELILSIQKNLQDILERRRGSHQPDLKLQMVLVTRGSVVLEHSNPDVQRVVSRILGEREIQVHLNSPVERIVDREDGSSSLYIAATNNNPEREIPFDNCFWCTSAAGAAWLSEKTPFPCDSQGFVKVESTYQVLDHPGVFAAGDCAHRIEHPRPKAGVFAVRAGPPLLDNLVAALLRQPLKPHIPQSIFLSIISTGNEYAVAARGRDFCQEGWWVWKWKNTIDRSWMAEYSSKIPDALEDDHDTIVQK